MNKEKQRIAIAEECGWVLGENNFYEGMPCAPKMVPNWTYKEKCVCFDDLPDYLSDLNAMHEAEKVLRKNPRMWRLYGYTLAKVCEPNSKWFPEYTGFDVATYAHATPAQRAEAFLRTIGKWKQNDNN